jgi:hypothetical protein
MITCPVCEHTQAGGDECEQCGKRFGGRAATAVPDVPRLAELELTPHQGGRVEVPSQLMAELEMTQLGRGPDLPPVSFPEMERTRTGVGDVDAPPMADLELGRAPDDGARTEIPWGAVKCRYCGHEQVEGKLCDQCGMRLPSFEAAAPAQVTTIPDDLRVRCKCGSPARPGARCGNCGELVPVPAEA